MKILSDIRLLLLGLWLGAACFFIFVAQSSFAVLPTRELAGSVVNRTLAGVNLSGLGIAVVALLMSLIFATGASRLRVWSERFLLLVFAAACAVGQFVIALWLSIVRAQIGRPIDEVAADDPLRIQFNNLHEYSTWALFVAMGAAFVTFFVIASRKFGPDTAKPRLDEPYDFKKEFKI